jgi:hypothetical protein
MKSLSNNQIKETGLYKSRCGGIFYFYRMRNFIVLFLLIGCSNQRSIKGRWHSQQWYSPLKITRTEFIQENDSPIPEDYKLINDSILVKGFEASLFPWKYTDTIKILKLTKDSLVLKDDTLIIRFYR